MTNKIARIVNGKIVYGEHSPVLQGNELQAAQNRRDMVTKHRKDMLQRNQVDYYKAYPKQAKNLSPELRRQLS